MKSVWVSVALTAQALFLCANAYYMKEFSFTDSNGKLTDWLVEGSKQGPSEGTKTLHGGKNSNSTTEDSSQLYGDIRNDVKSHENWYLLDHGGKCGYSSGNIPKIIGGQNADMGRYPWMVRLIFRSLRKDTERGLCGGSIINNRYVLTAAHCCTDDDDKKLAMIRVGEYDVHHTKDCYKGKCAPPILDIGIESVTNHYKFNKQSLYNDICLIRTSEDIEFNDYVQPVCLPVSITMDEKQFGGTDMVVAGWGQVESGSRSRLPEVLQENKVKVLSIFGCSRRFNSMRMRDSQVCAGGDAGNDVCAGDSGGPLMLPVGPEDGPKKHYIYGLVSFGMPCNHASSTYVFGVYTKVSSFLIWILDTITE